LVSLPREMVVLTLVLLQAADGTSIGLCLDAVEQSDRNYALTVLSCARGTGSGTGCVRIWTLCSTFVGIRVISKDLCPARSQDLTTWGLFFSVGPAKGINLQEHHRTVDGFKENTLCSKSHSTHLTYFVCQKINYFEIGKQKSGVTLRVGIVDRVQRCVHLLFSSCLLQPAEEFLCQGNCSPDQLLLICLTQENREMCP
jgi:hypothetical protein